MSEFCCWLLLLLLLLLCAFKKLPTLGGRSSTVGGLQKALSFLSACLGQPSLFVRLLTENAFSVRQRYVHSTSSPQPPTLTSSTVEPVAEPAAPQEEGRASSAAWPGCSCPRALLGGPGSASAATLAFPECRTHSATSLVSPASPPWASSTYQQRQRPTAFPLSAAASPRSTRPSQGYHW